MKLERVNQYREAAYALGERLVDAQRLNNPAVNRIAADYEATKKLYMKFKRMYENV